MRPNYINTYQGLCASQITIGIAGWLLQVLGIVPPPQWPPSEEGWILCCTPYHQLPAKLCNALAMNINMGLGYSRELSGLQQFISDSRETIQELDTLYIIGWARWMKHIVNGMPVGVEKVKCDGVMTIWVKLVRMTTTAWSLRREPHQQNGKDRARSKMPGMTGMTAPVPAVVVETSPSNLLGAWMRSRKW